MLIFGISTVLLFEQADGLVEFKKYKVINSPKVCGDKMCSEIDEERAKKGLSSRDIKICGDRPCYDISRDSEKPLNKSSPLGQIKLGIPIDLIVCKEGLDLVVRTTNLNPACIKKENIENLREVNWAISYIQQQEIFDKLAQERQSEEVSPKTLQDFDVILNIETDHINNERYLMFNGYGWHRLHNVEITISSSTFSESIRTKTNDRGHLNMPWPIPDTVGGRIYNIFATDGIHKFDIDIPIAPKDAIISKTYIDDNRCVSVTFPINWSGCDLYGKYLANIDFKMANLSDANLLGAMLTNKDLTGIDFSGASLKNANLDGTILTGANFAFANLIDAKIRDADISFANFQSANAYRTDFTGSNLTNANFQDATLSYAILAGVDLKNANLEGAGTWSTNLNNCKNHSIC